MEYKLSECVIDIIDNRGRNPEKYHELEQHPVIDNYLIKNDLYPDLNNVKRYIDNNTFAKFIRKYLLKGDVIMTLVGNGIGNVSMTPSDNAVIIQNTIGFRTNSEILKGEYLYYYFKHKKNDLINFDRGSSQPSIKKTDILKLIIDIPTIKVQENIVSILFSLDEKIEINKKTISTIEQLAQTLFKHWFVDFEFPNENGEPYKTSGEEMVESELGMMPKMFKAEHLSKSTNFLSGGTPKTKIPEYWNGEIPFFTPKDTTGSVYTTTTEKSITEEGLAKCSSKLYSKNTLFLTARGTVGKLNLANREMSMNQSCFALQHKEYKQYYLYFLLETLLREIIQGSNGAVFNAINLKDLNTLKVVSPPSCLVEKFEDLVTPIFEMLSEKEEENISLKHLRDTLLPKLLSGEIELPDETEVK